MVSQSVFGVEVRVACGHDALACEKPSVAVIGMEAVSLPRVVAEDDLRFDFANDPGDLAPFVESAGELPVDVTQETNLTGPFRITSGQTPRSRSLLSLAPRRQRLDVGIGVPRPFRSVCADQVMNDAAVGGPLCKQSSASELDIVRVSADGQGRGRSGEIARVLR